MKKKKYVFEVECFQDDYDTLIHKVNGHKIDESSDRLWWEILDMHRHNLVNYPEEKPTIEGAFMEIAERIEEKK